MNNDTLPKHEPGRVIPLHLDDLPRYLAINGLEACKVKAKGPIVLVQKADHEPGRANLEGVKNGN